MGSKNKLKRFKENETFRNVFQPSRADLVEGNYKLKGNWRQHFFKNDNPLVLELGCGKGEYSVGLAQKYPNKNFIGIDIKGARFWRGAKTAIEENIENVAFIRTQIELIEYIFAENEVDEIWITFPDPFLRVGKAQRRLTSARFSKIYKNVLKKDAIIHLKTDDPTLYAFTLETIDEEKYQLIYENNDIYRGELYTEELHYKTYYEKKHLENRKTIKYIRYTLGE